MNTSFFFKKMTDATEKEVKDYVEKKLTRLDRLISNLPPDGVNLHVICEQFEKHSAFEVEFVLKLPSETLTAKEASHAITKAVDLSFDRLIAQFKKTKEE